MNTISQLKKDFSRQGILIAFNGPFSHSLIEEIGNAAKSHLEAEQITPHKIIDVFAVYIEQTQNVRNYSVRRDLRRYSKDSAVVVVGHEGSEYTISSGNYILREDVQRLREHLSTVVALDKSRLRKLYKEQLRKETPAGATGAGVGIIDMARRSTVPPVFRFDDEDEQFAFFTLEVRVAGE